MRLFCAWVFVFLFAAPAHAEWRTAETRHFTIYSEGSETGLRDFAIKVERFDTMLRKRFAVSDEDTPQKLTIFMLRSPAAVATIYGNKGRDVAGFYQPRGEGSIAIVNRAGGSSKFDLDADAVLFHEYAHHFMIRYFPTAYPAWYVEGFAEFVGTSDFTKEGNAKVGMPPYYRAYGLLEQAPIPVDQLVTRDVSDFRADRLDAFYGRSWLLVHYLSFAPSRAGQLTKYLAAISGGASGSEAARTVFGDLNQLDKELKGYLGTKLHYVEERSPTAGPDKVETATLDPGADAAMVQRMLLMRGPNEKELAGLTAALRTVTGKYPKEAGPQLLLAEALFMGEDYEGAATAADAALKASPNLSRALLVKARAQIETLIAKQVSDPGQWKTARGWIVRANRADTNDPMPLFAYYQSFAQEGIDPPAIAFDGLERAYQMVPEDRSVRMVFADALARKREYSRAIRLVETVAFDPHNANGAVEARAYLKRLLAARDGKVDTPIDLSDDGTANKTAE